MKKENKQTIKQTKSRRTKKHGLCGIQFVATEVGRSEDFEAS